MKYLILICIVILTSCQNSERANLVKTVEEWAGKEIKFPINSVFTKYMCDTVEHNMVSDYKLMVYVDSLGCTSCKLQLHKWKELLGELDSVAKNRISFIFYACPKNKREFEQILKHDRFDYPICIDINDSLNIINKLPSDPRFQVFLLDKENKVIAVGSPLINPKIKELYFNMVSGKNVASIAEEKLLTTVSLTNNEINFGDFPWNKIKQTELTISNVGNIPLVINDVITSCGCTTVEYSKEPARPSTNVIFKINYKAEHPEHFNKTITIYCNADISPIRIDLRGNAY